MPCALKVSVTKIGRTQLIAKLVVEKKADLFFVQTDQVAYKCS